MISNLKSSHGKLKILLKLLVLVFPLEVNIILMSGYLVDVVGDCCFSPMETLPPMVEALEGIFHYILMSRIRTACLLVGGVRPVFG